MMQSMSEIDHSRLDGHLLRVLVAVVETGGITAAAQRLGVTQSAVSHLLDKLRAITGDPLFVKSGRGVVATARAERLAADARELLLALERFAASGAFDPAHWEATFTIAAKVSVVGVVVGDVVDVVDVVGVDVVGVDVMGVVVGGCDG